MHKREKEKAIVANLFLEIYLTENIIINQDEAYIFSNDDKIYTWANKKEKASIYMGEPNKYHKITIFAVISNYGDLFYMLTNARTNTCSYQYFL